MDVSSVNKGACAIFKYIISDQRTRLTHLALLSAPSSLTHPGPRDTLLADRAHHPQRHAPRPLASDSPEVSFTCASIYMCGLHASAASPSSIHRTPNSSKNVLSLLLSLPPFLQRGLGPLPRTSRTRVARTSQAVFPTRLVWSRAELWGEGRTRR